MTDQPKTPAQLSYEHQRQLYEDYTETMASRVNPMRAEGWKATELASQWAQIMLKTAFVLNGGGLLYLATLSTDPAKYQLLRGAVMSAATWNFIWGGGLAALCCGVVYLNFSFGAEGRWRNSNEMAFRAMHPLSPEAGHDKKADRFKAQARWLDIGVVVTVWLGMALAIAAYVMFTLGALELIPEALRNIPK